MKFLYSLLFSIILVSVAAANTNGLSNVDEIDATAQADPQFFANAHLWGQLFTGSLATMIAIVAVCMGLWLASNFPHTERSVSDLPGQSVLWDTLTSLGSSTYLVFIFILPYVIFKFYTMWFLTVGLSYFLIRLVLQFVKSRSYLAQLREENPKWSVVEEMGIEAALTERAETERTRVALEEEQVIEKSKREKTNKRIRIALPLKPKQ